MNYRFVDQKERRFKKLFLALPKALYDKNSLTQNSSVEQNILCGTHTLSGDFEIKPFLLADEAGKPAARCILTYYPHTDEAYIGFFECIEDFEACRILMEAAFEQAKSDGKSTIVGPVDASYWIKFRMKVDAFDKPPYALEPYNKSYYPDFWEKCGFAKVQGYFSNQLRMPTAEDHDAKCIKRFEALTKRGYTIEYPTSDNFNDKLYQVFVLLSKLYADFPCYTEISWEKFYEMYSGIKLVLSFDMAKLVYKDGELVGFSISVPNFGNATGGKRTLSKIRRIIDSQKNPSEFILIYMGVDDKHLGVGSMIAEAVKRSLEEKHCTAINALIIDGKVTGESYYNSSLTTEKYHYALFRKKLKQQGWLD